MTKTNDIHYIYDATNGIELIICDNSQLSYPLHCHVPVYTIGMVLAGAISLSKDYGSNIYHRNQIFTIPPYMPHCIETNDNYTLLTLCIPKKMFRDCNIEKMKTNILSLLNRSDRSNKINQSQITQILNCLSAFENNNFPIKWKSNTSSIDILRQQLELCPESNYSVEQMAHAAYISKYHFIRKFKREVGLTPHQFQIQNRIHKAQRLISDGETLTEVALTTGFCDQSHFIRYFEKYVGLTPTAYKMSCEVFIRDANG